MPSPKIGMFLNKAEKRNKKPLASKNWMLALITNIRRTPDNTFLVGGETSRAVLDAWKDRAPEKIRSNTVHGLEYFVGGSPEALKAMSRDEQDAYFTDALEWLRARHGAENVLSAVIHHDKSIPHMTVMTIPLPHLKPCAAADGGSSKTAESGQALILNET